MSALWSMQTLDYFAVPTQARYLGPRRAGDLGWLLAGVLKIAARGRCRKNETSEAAMCLGRSGLRSVWIIVGGCFDITHCAV
jgi:hypothetical protein